MRNRIRAVQLAILIFTVAIASAQQASNSLHRKKAITFPTIFISNPGKPCLNCACTTQL